MTVTETPDNPKVKDVLVSGVANPNADQFLVVINKQYGWTLPTEKIDQLEILLAGIVAEFYSQEI